MALQNSISGEYIIVKGISQNYDIVFTNKKSPAGNEPKGESCCPGFLFKHNVRL